MEELGMLQPVDPKSLWGHEAHEFTPWLLANADGLADALGIDLEFETAEHRVGAFSLDLIGEDQTNGTILMVENQLASTDHSHLGQILTYAAGTGASTIVWIATSFREEHRQALDWLNEQTSESTHFFGIELQAFRIGDSLPAPHFKVVVEPNDWQKAVRQAAQGQVLSGKAGLYAEFWELLLECLNEEEPTWTRRRAGKTSIGQNWIDMPSPVAGTHFSFSFARGSRLRSELYISAGSEDSNRAIFEALLEQRLDLEAAFGRSLEFDPLEHRLSSRIGDYRDGEIETIAAYDDYVAFFLDSGRRFRIALSAIDLTEPLR